MAATSPSNSSLSIGPPKSMELQPIFAESDRRVGERWKVHSCRYTNQFRTGSRDGAFKMKMIQTPEPS
jgi:hypothetical protein